MMELVLKEVLPYLLLAMSLFLAIDYLIVLPIRMQNTVGKIIGYTGKCFSQTTRFAAKFEFSHSNKTFEATNDIWSKQKRYEIGKLVLVEYVPGLEQYAHIRSAYRMLATLAFLAMTVTAVVGLYQQFGLSRIGATTFGITSVLIIIGIFKREIRRKQKLSE